ncbi:hypothetical protein ACFWGN_18570 [Oerskovia sp. NPDC060338]|uniref:hypothetical protein n=1 Tax=Oerskovia sp. NPDC060338 TaxID=3347100 RepID=UPI003657D9AB
MLHFLAEVATDPTTINNIYQLGALFLVLIAGQAASWIMLWRGQSNTKNEVKAVQHQFENNSGSTIRDAVDRIESKVDDQGKRLEDHLRDVGDAEKPSGYDRRH